MNIWTQEKTKIGHEGTICYLRWLLLLLFKGPTSEEEKAVEVVEGEVVRAEERKIHMKTQDGDTQIKQLSLCTG